MDRYVTQDTPATDAVLNLVAHLPTTSLPHVADAAFFRKLTDRDFMRIGVLLARKGFLSRDRGETVAPSAADL